ncbi:hypothetical protein D3C86_1963810 [compost metagenome]
MIDIVSIELEILVVFNSFDKIPRYSVHEKLITFPNSAFNIVWNLIVVFILARNRIVINVDMRRIPLDDIHILDTVRFRIYNREFNSMITSWAHSRKCKILK